MIFILLLIEIIKITNFEIILFKFKLIIIYKIFMIIHLFKFKKLNINLKIYFKYFFRQTTMNEDLEEIL